MKSLDKLSYIEHRIEYLTNYVKELEKENIKCDIDIQKERIDIYKGIKQDLEILEILAKYLKLQMLPCMEDTPKVIAWLREYDK